MKTKYIRKMRINKYWILMVTLEFGVFTSCHQKGQTETSSIEDNDTTSIEVYVDTIKLYPKVFQRQLICNGKLRAFAKCELSSSEGAIDAVYVKNGSRVVKGQIIAKTDNSEALLNVEKAKKDLEKAKVDLTDKLIGLGYDGISAQVPKDVLYRAKISTGYFSAQFQLQSAYYALRKCSLTAPISGRVANLENKRGQRLEKICTIVDDKNLDVEFNILESEMKNIHLGQSILVSPFANESLFSKGKIVNINPLIDDKGMIKITAQISNSSGKLLDGMNAKIIVEDNVPHSFVVPKDAVLERDGYHVIFTYLNGEAIWTYVDVINANISSFAIKGCQRKGTQLNKGDIVIVSGNLNLADGTKVKIKKKTL